MLTRRQMLATTSTFAGYALSVDTVLAQAIKTDTDGIIAGDQVVKIGDYEMPVYEARPATGKDHAIVLVISSVMFLGGQFIGPKNPNPEKLTPFECGNDTEGAKNTKLSVKFYLTAILFVIFDVEAIFIYPWAIQFRSLGAASLITMLGFVATLGLALVYCWKKGALEWEK